MSKKTTVKATKEAYKMDNARFVEKVEAVNEASTETVDIADDIRKLTGIDISTLPSEVQTFMISQHLEKVALAKQLAEVKEAASKGKVESFDKALRFYSNPEYSSFSVTFPLEVSWKYNQQSDGSLIIHPAAFELSRWEFKQKVAITMTADQQLAIQSFLQALGYQDLEKLDQARMQGEKEYKASLQRKSERALKKASKVSLETDKELAERNAKILAQSPILESSQARVKSIVVKK